MPIQTTEEEQLEVLKEILRALDDIKIILFAGASLGMGVLLGVYVIYPIMDLILK